VNVTGKKAGILPDKDVNPMIKKLIEETLLKWCPGVDSVNFKLKPEKPGGEENGGEKNPAGKGLNI